MKSITAIITAAVLTLVPCTSSFAYVTGLETEFDAQKGQVTVSASANGITSVMITEEGKTPENYSVSDLPVDYHQLYANGDFEFKFSMPAGTPKGKYGIYVTDGDNTVETEFVYFVNSESANVIKIINSASSEADFISKVELYAYDLGVNTSASDYSRDVLSVMYSVYDSYTDAAEFYSAYQSCSVICSFKGKTRTQIEQILSENDYLLGIDYTEDYSDNSFISTQAKDKLCALLSTMDYPQTRNEVVTLVGPGQFSDVYDALCSLSVVATEDGWKKIEELYKSDSLFLKSKILEKNADYAKANSSSVFMNMSGMSYNKISDLKTNFDKAVELALSSSAAGNTSSDKSNPSYQVGASQSAGTFAQYEELPGSADGIKASVPSPSEDRAYYYDVCETDWYYDSVTRLGGAGIVSGYTDGSFGPDNCITRAEFAKLVVEAFSVEAPYKEFSDVSYDSWYAPYVRKAAGAGIIRGYEGVFNPEAFITRQDAAVILYRTSAVSGYTYTGFAKTSDMNEVSAYAWPAVGAFYDCGIINGVGDGRFVPLSNITRAEAVQMLLKTINDLQSRL